MYVASNNLPAYTLDSYRSHIRTKSVIAAITTVFTAVLVIWIALPVRSQTIYYDYTTELVLPTGPDNAGLTGATLDVMADVSSSAVYVDRFGYPAVVMNNDATVTISGASEAANNGTFAMTQLAFYPSFAGLYTDPADIFPGVVLPVGGELFINITTTPTPSGSSELVGNTVNILDFAPATGIGGGWYVEDGPDFTAYVESNPVVTATQGASGTPEPSAGVYAISLLGLLGAVVHRRRASVQKW